MKKCTKCEHEYADEFNCCPHCGSRWEQEEKPILAKTGQLGEKIVVSERNSHFIKNAIVLIFSLILLITSFFAGAEYDLMLDGGLSIPIQHDYIQVAEGSLAFLETNEERISDYIQNFEGYEILAEAEEKCREKINADSASDLDLLNAMGHYISAHSNANYIKFGVFIRKDSSSDNTSIVGKMEELYVKGGCGIGIWASVMQLCAMVICLVNIIRSTIALIRRKQIDNLNKKILLPFAFLLVKVAMMLTNPMLRLDTESYVLIAIYVLFIILLCAHKYLFEISSTKISKAFLCKNVTVAILGIVACCTALGSIISLNIDNLVNYNYTAGDMINVYTMYMFGMLQGSGEVTENILLGLVSYLAYLPLVICVATMGYSALRNLCEKLDNTESKYGKTLIARVIASTIFLVIIIAGISWMGNSMYEYGTISYKPAVSANLIVSLVACVALVVINIVWKIKPFKVQSVDVGNN